jgi:acetyl/propionyl-CoA carboxylase alpha subunit
LKRYWVRLAHEEVEVGVDTAAGGMLLVTIRGSTHHVELTEIVPSAYTLVVDGASHDLAVWDRAGPWTLSLDGSGYRAAVARARTGGGAGGSGAPLRSEEVRSPMPGLLVAMPVGEGSQVEMGQAVAIMEAMKMQMEIRAPHAGTVARVHARPGQELVAGQLLVTLE